MKDFRSIFINKILRWQYRRWVANTILHYTSKSTEPTIIDVGCGRNKIRSPLGVIGCDKFPVSDDIIETEADELPFENGSVSFLFSAHCLEHMANPIKAINEWSRAVGSKGVICFMLPHASRTFDYLRPLTASDHVITDFNNNVANDDDTHWAEFRDLTILSEHPAIPADYIEKAHENDFDFFWRQRLIHHHVWTCESFVELLQTLDMKVLNATDRVPGRKDSFAVIARPS